MKKLMLMVLVMLMSTMAFAQAPKLADPYQLKLADGTVLDTGGIGHAAPFYADFDGDNVPDLLVGEFKDGALRIYHNYGTKLEPVFKDFKFFEVDGVQAIVPPS